MQDQPTVIGEKERAYLTSVYEGHQVGDGIQDRISFLKNQLDHHWYARSDGAVTPENFLRALERGYLRENWWTRSQ